LSSGHLQAKLPRAKKQKMTTTQYPNPAREDEEMTEDSSDEDDDTGSLTDAEKETSWKYIL